MRLSPQSHWFFFFCLLEFSKPAFSPNTGS
jgi:hypothetical protein